MDIDLDAYITELAGKPADDDSDFDYLYEVLIERGVDIDQALITAHNAVNGHLN
jgi:hypothetical protein